MPITDPHRLLPQAYAYPIPPPLPCYVSGCYAQASLCRLRRGFGAVACCAAHDPARFGQERSFGLAAPDADVAPGGPQAEEPELTPEQLTIEMLKAVLARLGGPQRPDGGTKAKLVKPRPQMPPSGQAISLPGRI